MKIIKNINQISTKKGDLGKSKNYSNEEFYKSDLLFNTLGDMDELSSSLGMAYHHTTYKEEIKDIQRDLQDIKNPDLFRPGLALNYVRDSLSIRCHYIDCQLNAVIDQIFF